MKKKIIWLVVSGLMVVSLLAATCYPAPKGQVVPATPAAPAPSAKEPVVPKEETALTRVEISDFAFVPATITVAVGTTVTWTNKDSVVHTVSSRDTLFDSGNLSRGATFSYTFNQRGTFEYRCEIHPAMTGKVIVGEEDSGSAKKNGNGADYQGADY